MRPASSRYSAVKIVSPTFYSLRDSRTPVLVSVASVLANLGDQSAARAAVRISRPGRRHGTRRDVQRRRSPLAAPPAARPGLKSGAIGVTFTKILVASLAMGAVAHATVTWLTVALPGALDVDPAVHVFAGIGAGVVALLVASGPLRIEEFDWRLPSSCAAPGVPPSPRRDRRDETLVARRRRSTRRSCSSPAPT